MKIKFIDDCDFINYKEPNMFIGFPFCTWKCGKENCQNYKLKDTDNVDIKPETLVDRYMNNSMTTAIVFGGLEPFESYTDMMYLINEFRKRTNDVIVIYTGWEKNEIEDKIKPLMMYPNIVLKYGRYLPNQKSHFDEILGVDLASDNQYGEILN
jgi:pyruvate-formate lyase-activating enzyme